MAGGCPTYVRGLRTATVLSDYFRQVSALTPADKVAVWQAGVAEGKGAFDLQARRRYACALLSVGTAFLLPKTVSAHAAVCARAAMLQASQVVDPVLRCRFLHALLDEPRILQAMEASWDMAVGQATRAERSLLESGAFVFMDRWEIPHVLRDVVQGRPRWQVDWGEKIVSRLPQGVLARDANGAWDVVIQWPTGRGPWRWSFRQGKRL